MNECATFLGRREDCLSGGSTTSYKRAYVVGYLPAPPDSIAWPTGFIRGVQGIKAELDKVTCRTANALEYVGEWHSHPEFTVAPQPY